jgi:hypothetical protein
MDEFMNKLITFASLFLLAISVQAVEFYSGIKAPKPDLMVSYKTITPKGISVFTPLELTLEPKGQKKVQQFQGLAFADMTNVIAETQAVLASYDKGNKTVNGSLIFYIKIGANINRIPCDAIRLTPTSDISSAKSINSAVNVNVTGTAGNFDCKITYGQ